VFLHYLRILKFKKSYKQALHDAALQWLLNTFWSKSEPFSLSTSNLRWFFQLALLFSYL
jgi:hypothetical protein